jgi:hypothetical protein
MKHKIIEFRPMRELTGGDLIMCCAPSRNTNSAIIGFGNRILHGGNCGEMRHHCDMTIQIGNALRVETPWAAFPLKQLMCVLLEQSASSNVAMRKLGYL